MKNILIIKTGAAGDVIRTTVLLHLFQDDKVTWITKRINAALLPQARPNFEILHIEDLNPASLGHFDLVISLDDEPACADIATQVDKDELVGAYVDKKKVIYTSNSSEWFDMGLVSRFGKERADEIKKENTATLQAMLYRMFGEKFEGQEYCLREDLLVQPNEKRIGIEARAGDRWPTKRWNQFDALALKLREMGYEVYFFGHRENIKDYMEDIAKCALVIAGDTLGMHIALGLKIPTVAIFTVTSPTEIYGYNRTEKIVSDKLNEAFYSKEYLPEVLNAITLDDVLNAVKKLLPKVSTL